MTESLFWSSIVKPQLSSFGKLKRVEDLIEKGTPDVVYCLRWLTEPARTGWIELKKLKVWPANQGTAIRLPHFTVEQALFLESWGRAGAGAFLLAQVEKDFVLFRWDTVRAVQVGLRKNEFRSRAAVLGDGKFPTRDVLRCLTAR